MPANRKLPTRGATALLLAIVVGLAIGIAPTAARAASRADAVKYYAVTASYGGKPENLTEIAVRFLGDGVRATEIFDLNVGRRQPDGGALKDPAALHAGWYIQLPWDAVGPGVHMGELPTTPTGVPTSKGPRPTPPQPSTSTPRASSSTTTPAAGGCAVAASNGNSSNWAPLRMAPAQAWTRTHGEGVAVAVVDSGVDATLPQLTGRVAVGADIVSGSGRGNTDCLGSGTAMAGLIAAQPDQSSSLSGLAPGAAILPIRVVTTTPHAPAADQASAVEVAVSAGAGVIALGSYVDATDPAVAQAITDAVKHNVVVVAGAPTTTSVSAGRAVPGVLRVAGVGVDNKTAADFRPGTVDVTAPGVAITVLGISGIGDQVASGTDLAVAFVAGEVALVRSAHPDLSAGQVVHRVEATADKLASPAPNATFGWGIIDPSAAVNQTLPEENPTQPAVPAVAAGRPDSGPSRSGGSTVALALIAVIGLVAVAAFTFRVRRVVLARGGPSFDDVDQSPTDSDGSGGGRRADDREWGRRADDSDWGRRADDSGRGRRDEGQDRGHGASPLHDVTGQHEPDAAINRGAVSAADPMGTFAASSGSGGRRPAGAEREQY